MHPDEKLPAGFVGPTALPGSDEQQRAWQEANRTWWESHPMRYDWNEPLGATAFTAGYYAEIDRRFFQGAADLWPGSARPFDALIPYDRLPSMDVLEIGVGNGSHAQLLASSARSYTGIDLTEFAVRSTSERLRLAGVPGRIVRMDAEELPFPDASFDLVWSWGVIHHSSRTPVILENIARVLRPGGTATLMVYHRSWWSYYVMGVLHGLVFGSLRTTGSLHGAVQHMTDGALARYYSVREWRSLLERHFSDNRIETAGQKTCLLPFPAGRLKRGVARALPGPLAKAMASGLRMGDFLVSVSTRR